jgi:hypothetical protein
MIMVIVEVIDVIMGEDKLISTIIMVIILTNLLIIRRNEKKRRIYIARIPRR